MGEEGVGGLVAEGFDPRVQCWWCVGGVAAVDAQGGGSAGWVGVMRCDEV